MKPQAQAAFGVPRKNVVEKKPIIEFFNCVVYNNIVGRTMCISDQDAHASEEEAVKTIASCFLFAIL